MNTDPAKTLKILKEAGSLVVGRKSKAFLKERRRKVWTLKQTGMEVDQIVTILNTPNPGKELTKEELVTKDMVLNDLDRLQDDFKELVVDFDASREVGQQMAQYDSLYEEVMVQYHTCPEGSSLRAKFIDLARSIMDNRYKFLQSVGLVEKVADKKLHDHRHSVYDTFSDDQKQSINDQIFNMKVEQTGKATKQLPAENIQDAEYTEMDPKKLN